MGRSLRLSKCNVPNLVLPNVEWSMFRSASNKLTSCTVYFCCLMALLCFPSNVGKRKLRSGQKHEVKFENEKVQHDKIGCTVSLRLTYSLRSKQIDQLYGLLDGFASSLKDNRGADSEVGKNMGRKLQIGK